MSAAERKIKEQIASPILLPEQYRKEDATRRELDGKTRHGWFGRKSFQYVARERHWSALCSRRCNVRWTKDERQKTVALQSSL